MILWILLALIALGTVSSIAAFGLRAAPVYSSLANIAIWLTVAYSATSIDTIADDGTLVEAAASEPALSVLAFGNAAISVVVLLAAATGNYERTDAETPDAFNQI